MRAELTVYSLNGDNLIITVPLKGLQNSGKIENKGIEFALEAEPVNQLSVNATYSYIHMKTPVFATPKHHIFLSTRYRIKKLQLMASIQQITDLNNDPSPGGVNLVSYTMLNAKTAYQLTRNINLYVSGENLLGSTYQVNRYYTMPGTTVFAGINLTL